MSPMAWGYQTINQSADFVSRKFAGSRSLSAADRVAARFFDMKGQLRLTNQKFHGHLVVCAGLFG